MPEKLKRILFFAAITLVPTLLIWAPFYFNIGKFWNIPLPKTGMATIVANYDGPLYLVVAKTLYNPDLIRLNYSFPIPLEYYAAHFPLYPLLIRLFSVIAGYPYSMLLVSGLSAFTAIYFFYKFILDYTDKGNALFLTFIFAIFPARWLISRSVGSADPLFVGSILASIYYFKKEKYFSSALWGIAAQLTKSPAILLFVAYAAASLAQGLNKYAPTSSKYWMRHFQVREKLPLLLIPVALVSVFFLYKLTLNDFFAYFKSGDNIHLFFPPFQIFNFSSPWVGTSWLEEIIFVYLIAAAGFIKLIKKGDIAVSWFVGVFFTSILFVSHRDIMRYALPIVPFLFAGYSDFLTKKEFKYIIALLIIPIYLYSLAFISQNVMPISDWAPFL